jgi:DNA replication protein DnaC
VVDFMVNKIHSFCDQCLLQFCCRYLTGELKPKRQEFCVAYMIWKAIYDRSNIPKKFMFVNKQTSMSFGSVDAILDKYIKHLVINVDERGAGLFLFSDTVGNGKTHVAVMILNHYIVEKIRMLGCKCFDLDYPLVMYVDYAYLIDTLRYERDDYSTESFIDDIMNTNLLLLDDIGSGKMSDYAREQTNIIINYRYNKKLPIIATSNLSIEELSKDSMVGKRAMSRMTDNSLVVPFNCSSLRRPIEAIN